MTAYKRISFFEQEGRLAAIPGDHAPQIEMMRDEEVIVYPVILTQLLPETMSAKEVAEWIQTPDGKKMWEEAKKLLPTEKEKHLVVKESVHSLVKNNAHKHGLTIHDYLERAVNHYEERR